MYIINRIFLILFLFCLPDNFFQMEGEPLELEGKIFLYHYDRQLSAFETKLENSSERKDFIFIGGLTNGFLATGYISPLSKALKEIGWTMIQPLLSSSYSSYGISSLDKDVEELDFLIEYLIQKKKTKSIVLCGHSTGCQDSVHYMLKGKYKEFVKGIILQAPVSDRESMALEPETKKWYLLAKQLVEEGKKHQLLPIEANHGFPITAYRYYSLGGRMTDDDMFSSDLNEAELKQKLGHLKVPVLIVYSLHDQYVPKEVNKEVLLQKFTSSIPSSEGHLIKGDHSLEGTDGLKFVQLVSQFVTQKIH